LCPDVCYPESTRPTENAARYPATNRPSENFFDLEDPLERLRNWRPIDVEDLPPLRLPPQPPFPSAPQ
jgi:hypothetical protein